jgi:hypothetical protein
LRFSGVFLSAKEICAELPVSSLYQPYHFSTDVDNVTIVASGLWLGTRAGAGGTAHYLKGFLTAVHGLMDNRSNLDIVGV